MIGVVSTASQIAAHDRVYKAIKSSDMFQRLLKCAMGEDYPAGSMQYSFAGMRTLRWISEEIKMAPDGSVVDIGCGEGGLSGWIAALSGREVVGTDTSAEAIDLAVNKRQKNCNFYIGNYCHLPVENGSVGAIVALDSVQHAPTAAMLADELSRICMPKGRFLFTHLMPLLPVADLATRDPFCAALVAKGFNIQKSIRIDPDLSMRFRVYALAYENREVVIRSLGVEFYDSLMAEARYLHSRIGLVEHLGVLAIKHG